MWHLWRSGHPDGDCDCNGNQFDECGVCGGPAFQLAIAIAMAITGALDVCGGDCVVDADADGLCDDLDDCVGEFDACGVCNGPGAIFECGCADIPAGNCDCDGNQFDALDVCGGDCLADENGDGICDENTVEGCIDPMACNFDMDANTDDGSCLIEGETCDDMDAMTVNDIIDITCVCTGEAIVLGCLDSLACNFDMDANTGDDSCEFPGEACDDMIEETVNDSLNADCFCVGDTIDVVLDREELEFGMFPNPTTGDSHCALGANTQG